MLEDTYQSPARVIERVLAQPMIGDIVLIVLPMESANAGVSRPMVITKVWSGITKIDGVVSGGLVNGVVMGGDPKDFSALVSKRVDGSDATPETIGAHSVPYDERGVMNSWHWRGSDVEPGCIEVPKVATLMEPVSLTPEEQTKNVGEVEVQNTPEEAPPATIDSAEAKATVTVEQAGSEPAVAVTGPEASPPATE